MILGRGANDDVDVGVDDCDDDDDDDEEEEEEEVVEDSGFFDSVSSSFDPDAGPLEEVVCDS